MQAGLWQGASKAAVEPGVIGQLGQGARDFQMVQEPGFLLALLWLGLPMLKAHVGLFCPGYILTAVAFILQCLLQWLRMQRACTRHWNLGFLNTEPFGLGVEHPDHLPAMA